MSPARASRPASYLRVVADESERTAAEGAADWSRDRERLLAAAAGDRAAAVALYDQQLGSVHAAIIRVMGVKSTDHADSVQRVFVELIRSAPRFRAECSLGTWIARIAAHVALNALRAQRRRRAVFSSDEPPDIAGPSVADPALLIALRDALAQISPDQAEAVLLHDLLGHDLAEIAALTGATVAATQSRLVRGRKALRRSLDETREAPR